MAKASKAMAKGKGKGARKTDAGSAPRGAIVRNIVEEPWQEFPGHFGGALSKALVRPETAGSRLIDYRISTLSADGLRGTAHAQGAGADLSRARRGGNDGVRRRAAQSCAGTT